MLAVVRPYKRADDFRLAVISSILLTTSFSLSFSLMICEDSIQCVELMGFSDKLTTSLFAVFLAAIMLLVTIVILLKSTLTTTRTLLLKATGYGANLELPSFCDHHIFMSHVWATGQDKCHAIARKLQLYLPNLKLWLDVDQLDDITKLEQYIERSAVVLIFYSDGYFQSRNCRREFLHALKLRKPLIIVYDGDDNQINAMTDICGEIFSVERLVNDGYSRQEALNLQLSIKAFEVLYEDLGQSVQWLKISAFSTEALKLIYKQMLMSLPRAQDPIYKTQLEKGLHLPGEIDPMHKIGFDIEIIVNNNDKRAVALAEELWALNNEKIELSCSRDVKSEKEVNIDDEINRDDDIDVIEQGNSGCSTKALDAQMNSFTRKDDVDKIEIDMDRRPSTLVRKQWKCEERGLSSSLYVRKSEIQNFVEEEEEKELFLQNEGNIPRVFLLHLSKETFNDDNRAIMTESIQQAREEQIPIILVHEQDLSKGAAPDFSYFFQHTPQELMDSPINLYSEIAIPLYTRIEYRQISLHYIVEKIKSSVSCEDKKKSAKSWRRVLSFSKA